MRFDAFNIETAFAQLAKAKPGKRGTGYDADVFRGGRAKTLSVTLVKATDALEARANALSFRGEDAEPGESKARIDAAIGKLRKIANSMSASDEVTPENYLWEVIGCLVSTIAALLDKAEAAGN
ncbi:hypothetical protein [uncultured Ralstonia sp.]|jgi:hypothetical protein|uniref:hypothetical protein n=1 Tax=uncultured Ralstonia sp. TaxID=114715 RepID=UPI001EA7425F|nr:hypothetical protein [uncultured Ralstonia sp.]UCF24480.1 MAG: hypothetical protein JSV72_03140 [Ralstonia sp.]